MLDRHANLTNKLTVAVTTALLTAGASAQDLSPENQRNLDNITGLTVLNTAGLATGLLAPPPADKVGELAEYLSNLGLKAVPGVLQAPPTVVLEPNAACGYRYPRNAHTPDTIVNYENIFGVELGVPSSWGVLDNGELASGDEQPPELYHYNTGAWVTLRRNHVDLNGSVERDANGDPRRTILFTDQNDRLTVERGDVTELDAEFFPIGTHTISWEWENKLDLIFDVALDPALFLAEMKWAARSKAIADQQKRFGRVWDDAAIKWAKTLEEGFEWSLKTHIAVIAGSVGFEVAVNEVDDNNYTAWPTGVFNTDTQAIRVLDQTPPQVWLERQPDAFEATTLGGEFGQRHFDEIRALVRASDACDRPVVIEPEPIGTRFWPTGVTTTMQWCVRDLGPTSSQGGFNRACTDVQINVEDTLPPLLLPPNSLSVIANSEQALNVGTAGVFDLADPDVVVANDAPATFPVGRTEVTWTATDSSGNSVQKSQWVSVKESNTVPTAESQAGINAISFEPVRIELTATDPDQLDGRFDQLGFRIQQPPENGFFVAPLFPFFIEDHRTHRINPDGTYSSWRTEAQAACEATRADPEEGVMIDPFYVDVLDDGTVYALDYGFDCGGGSPTLSANERLSKWTPDAEGALQFESALDLSGGATTPISFEIDSRGRLWYIIAGSEAIYAVDGDLNELARYEFDWFTEINPSTGNRQSAFNRSNLAIRSIVVDDNDIAYVTDGSKLFAYDISNLIDDPNYGGSYFPLLYTLARSNGVDTTVEPYRSYASIGTGGYADMELDSEGNVYVSDEPTSRVFKFQAARLSEDRSTLTQEPEFIGWIGRCDSNLDPTVLACDLDRGTSIGYSCQDDLCGATNRQGDGQGQFSRNRGIAMAPNDILYVTDTDNFRVQRFTPEGYFAGEAVSECDGNCFVLGDFGVVTDVTVNSNFFYLLDSDQQFTHIFQTTPITDIDDQSMQQTQSAFVTYQSDNNYVGSDSFSFVALDGLAESAPGTVQLDVTRNYRAPIATEGLTFVTNEDTPVNLALSGLDPDDDTLAFIIARDPRYGTINQINDVYTYTPDADFNGEDSFEFVATDAPTSMPALESAPVLATIQVSPVNDLPIITVDAPSTAGSYYPYALSFTVEDADPEDRPRIALRWGDGTEMDSASDGLSVGGADGITRVLLSHTMEANAPARLTHTICVSDADSSDILTCSSPDVTATATFETVVEDMVDLAVDVDDSLPRYDDPNVPDQQLSEPALDGVDEVTFTVTVRNNPAENEVERDATGVQLEIEQPEETRYLRSTASAGSCGISALRLSCSLGTMPAFAEAVIDVTVIGNGVNLADEIATLHAEVNAVQTDPGGDDNTASRQIDLLFNPDLDADGDGVPNGQDAFPGDPLETEDTDADGIGNNADTDDDGDRLPDIWEQRFGLDALDAVDAGADLDGDGVSNGDEYLSGTRPDTSDSDLDTVPDASDNCARVVNFNQFDVNGNAAGDACDPASFAAAAWVGDVDGSSTSDYALIRVEGGTVTAFLKDSATDLSVGGNTLALADSAQTSSMAVLSTVAGDLGIVGVAADGSAFATVFDAASGTERFTVSLFDAAWLLSAAALDADELLAVARNPVTGEVRVERRAAANGSLLATHDVGNEVAPVTIAGAGSFYALLTVRDADGAVELSLANRSDGSVTDSWRVAGGDVLTARLGIVGDRIAVLTQSIDGAAIVSVFEAGVGNAAVAFAPFADEHAALKLLPLPDLDALAVASASAASGVRIATFAVTDGSLLGEYGLQDATVATRDFAAASGLASELASLVATASGALSLDVIDADDGANPRTLTAVSALPPPPPPPPPAPTPQPPGGGSGGGGGGAVAPLTPALLLVALVLGLRRHRDAASERFRRDTGTHRV